MVAANAFFELAETAAKEMTETDERLFRYNYDLSEIKAIGI